MVTSESRICKWKTIMIGRCSIDEYNEVKKWKLEVASVSCRKAEVEVENFVIDGNDYSGTSKMKDCTLKA